jgi:hypothetical protein
MSSLSDLERQRVIEIAKAVAVADWDWFSFLSDEPFLNPQATRETFEEACVMAVEGLGDWQNHCDVGYDDNGARIIHIRVENKITRRLSIFLTLHSEGGFVSIWTFHDNPFAYD